MLLLPPTSTLFPYTTLFRSTKKAPSSLFFGTRGAAPAVPPEFLQRGSRSGGTGPTHITRVEPREQRSEEHTSELQSLTNLVCRLLLEKKNNKEHGRRRQARI